MTTERDTAMPVDRRTWLQSAVATGAGGWMLATAQHTAGDEQPPVAGEASLAAGLRHAPQPRVIDTNASLFNWPGRWFENSSPDRMAGDRLRFHVNEAWVGSFEALLQRDLTGVNDRLVEACASTPWEPLRPVVLRPFGTVNPAALDWEEDLRRCVEVHRMRGLRLYPNYHGYDLTLPALPLLLELAAEKQVLVQIAVSQEDVRTQHPIWRAPDVNLQPLPDLLKKVPRAKVQLLNHKLRGLALATLAPFSGLSLDTARVEGADGLAELVRRFPEGRVWWGSHGPFFILDAAVIKVVEAQLSEAELENVLSRGAARALSDGDMRWAKKFEAPPQFQPEMLQSLQKYDVWDAYGLPADSQSEGDFAALKSQMDRAFIRRAVVFLHVGLGTCDPRFEQDAQRPALDVDRWWPGENSPWLGFLQGNATRPVETLAAIERWIANGPLLGVYFPGGRWGALPCTDKRYDALVERLTELEAPIMQHTWLRTGGKDFPGTSTPAELAELARRHPQQNFVCAHAGGQWEDGVRAIRDLPNVWIETSGFDPTAGFIEFAIREIGVERILFGSHLPGRSLGTELGKVLGARTPPAAGPGQSSLLNEDATRAILGGNLRTLLAPQLRRKEKAG